MVAASALVGATSANAMTPKTVHYSCQGGKSINVKYYFNNHNLPTKAVSNLAGRTRVLPINLAHSDSTGTTFGKAGSYMIGSDAVTATSYNQVTLSTVTAPNNKILYKECRPN